jgi:hypothetical protein
LSCAPDDGGSANARDGEARVDFESGSQTAERQIDRQTARLFAELWKALVARTQVVEEVGKIGQEFDETGHYFWQGGKDGRVGSTKEAIPMLRE